MRIQSSGFLVLLSFPFCFTHAGVPTFQFTAGGHTYTLAGSDPASNASTEIPTVLVPITLSFESKQVTRKPFVLDARADVARVLRSPVFTPYAFGSGNVTQYIDAMLRSTFPKAARWHTLLGRPEVKPVTISVPAGYGYVLSSRKEDKSVAVVDLEFVEKQVFARIPEQAGKLVIAFAHNTTYYADADATVCCTWGTHGIDPDTKNSFVLASFLHDAPSIVEDFDVQPITQQLAEFFYDPMYDPQQYRHHEKIQGNEFPAWLRPATMRPGDAGACGGRLIGSSYFLLEPTDTNRKNNFPASTPFLARAGGVVFHLQNTALLQWYTGPAGPLGTTYSFPNARVLAAPAERCPAPQRRDTGPPEATVSAIPNNRPPNGHELIGYWTGYGIPGPIPPAQRISPQWDVIIAAFSTPDKNAPDGTMQFRLRNGVTAEQFKEGVAYLKSQGKKVLLSLGGGGLYFTFDDPEAVPNFVSSVAQIVREYGFDGVDIDFETPSLSLAPGDTDFKHPTTPSVVNLISALRQLHDQIGPQFMITLVPEGSQIPGGYPSYGGQFGSYLPLTYALRDILAFVDVQDYNTPPLEGLDGEIYQSQTVDYHAAVTELLLHGFNVGGDTKSFFPPLPANKVAVGFLTGYEDPETVSKAMEYFITGKAPAGTKYELIKRAGYPGMIGAMFWTLDADHRENYRYSNVIGPQLHNYPRVK
jgi:chitinase